MVSFFFYESLYNDIQCPCLYNWSQFELEYMNISSRHSNSNFAHSFYFYCLMHFAKCIDLWWVVFLWCELLSKLSIYTLKSDQWITISWAKFELELTTNIHLLQSSIQSHLQKRGLRMPVHQNSFRRKIAKNVKYYIRHFTFLHQNFVT